MHGTLGWRHAFGDVRPDATLALDGGGAFLVTGTPLAEDSLVVEAGFDATLSATTTLGVSYEGEFADAARDHGIRGSLTARF